MPPHKWVKEYGLFSAKNGRAPGFISPRGDCSQKIEHHFLTEKLLLEANDVTHKSKF
jgi:hypothetical protein